MKVIWITGAGRSGTHLLGMLADGHPEVNVFPLELRIVQDWPELVTIAGTGSQRLPGAVLDRYMVSRYLPAAEWRDRFPGTARNGEPDPSGGTFGLQDYLLSLNRRLYGEGERHFLFHCPGCQVSTFLGPDPSTTGGRVVLMLRHPLQNYLAWTNHYLQKGGGYCRQDQVRADIGLSSVLHLSLFRVLKAFAVAAAFSGSPGVLTCRLEDFSASPVERRRVWDFLGISHHPALEHTTRQGREQDAHSGLWKVSHIKRVTEDLYDPVLTEAEFSAFQRCEPLFSGFYPRALSSAKVVPGEKARDLLYQRERTCLQSNLHALRKRRERVLALLRERPQDLKGFLRWPLRTLYRMVADGPLYPMPYLLRSASGYRRALTGLEGVPDLIGPVAPGDSQEAKGSGTRGEGLKAES
jgi:hypothetical protein